MTFIPTFIKTYEKRRDSIRDGINEKSKLYRDEQTLSAEASLFAVITHNERRTLNS
jgi:hypothetical protein